MIKKDNISDILGELNQVLSGLTEENRQKIEQEFKPQSQVQKPPESKTKQTSPPKVSTSEPVSFTSSPAPAIPSSPEIPRSPAAPLEHSKSVQMPTNQQQTQQPQAPQTPVYTQPQVPLQPKQPSQPQPSQQPQAPPVKTAAPQPPQAPAKPASQKPPPTKIPVSPVPAGAPEADSTNEQVFRLACFYPKGRKDVTEIFFTKLLEVLQKTTKKDYKLERAVVEEINYNALSISSLAEKCKLNKAEAAFFISESPMNVMSNEVQFFNLTLSKIEKRFVYVDFVVELMLLKKK